MNKRQHKTEQMIYTLGANMTINHYENLNQNQKLEFLNLLNKIMGYVDNYELLFQNFKYYIKNGIHTIEELEYYLLFEAAMPGDASPLSDKGYKKLYQKYKNRLDKDLEEERHNFLGNENVDGEPIIPINPDKKLLNNFV